MSDKKILKYLYKFKNDGKLYDVSLIFKNKEKHIIDDFVVEMQTNGYVDKPVKGHLGEFELGPGDDKNSANNSLCKITPKGIEYIENYKNIGYSKVIAFISLGVSFISITIAILTYLNK